MVLDLNNAIECDCYPGYTCHCSCSHDNNECESIPATMSTGEPACFNDGNCTMQPPIWQI